MDSKRATLRPATMVQMQARYGPHYRWLLLLSVMVGAMAAIMSSTIVNVAIPDMSAHFMLGQARAQWATSAFMAAMTVSMLTTPWVLARYGYRRTYVGTMVLLLIGGLVGGFSNTFELVLAARVAEGLAAGVVQPIPAIIIMRAFAPHEQGRASGIFGIGGVLVDGFGWRAIFFMVVPFCLVALWLAYRYLPITGPGGVAANADNVALDWRGLLLVSIGTLCLLNAMVALSGGATGESTLLLGCAVIALLGFIHWQKRLGATRREPLMNLALFACRPFAMGSVVSFIYGAALFGSTYLLPVFMLRGLGLSASHVGSILLPAGLVLGLTIALVGRLADRYPAHLLVSIGLVLLALSFTLMRTVGLGSVLWVLVVLTALGRLGLGFILPSLNLGALRPLEKVLLSQGASGINFVRMLGGAIGVSLCGIVLEWRLAAHGDSLTQATSSAARLAAFHDVFILLAALCALALVAAWQLSQAPATELEPGPL